MTDALTKEKEHDRPSRPGGQGYFPKYFWSNDVASAVKMMKERTRKCRAAGFPVEESDIDECFPVFKEGDE